MIKSLNTALLEDHTRWLLWWPVGMAAGILFYFQLLTEPSLTLVLLCAGLVLACIAGVRIFYKDHRLLTETAGLFWVYALVSLIVGFTVAKVRTELLGTPLLKEAIRSLEITGTLIDIEHPDLKKPDKRRITIDQVQYESGVPSTILPTKVRLNTAALKLDAEPGDQIRCRVSLLPLSPPVSLQGYNFQRQAYFAGIGAVGRVQSCQTLSKKPKTKLYQGRYKLTQALRKHLPGPTGEIAAALITGDRSGIPKDIRQHFTDAGIAHILAISGLHVTLVAGILFFLIRRGLGLVPYLAENYGIKKWAAVAAIAATGLYLAISGYGFPAQRAFMMTTLVMVGILYDRNPLSMRSLAIAATVILSLYPKSIVSVSFQLSFAAVTGLVAVYEGGYQPLKDWMVRQSTQRWIRRPLGYGFGIVLTTLVATVATTPFVVYTFNRFTLQAILGNLVAIPLTSLWIMPLGVLSVLSLSVGGSDTLFWLWGLGIHWLCQSAEWIAALPGAAIPVATPHPGFLMLTTVGGLWLCLWQKRWRWLGLVPLIASIGFLFFDHHPHIYLAGDGSVMAYRFNRTLYVSSEKRGAFYFEQWARELGGLEVKPWPGSNILLTPDILLMNDPYHQRLKDIQQICRNHDQAFILSNGYIWRQCQRFVPSQHIIDRRSLIENSTQFIYLTSKGPSFVCLRGRLGKRPWYIAR
ncbi:ComEC/Rec2 family competence protein [Candidatus Finniella inopinata]|uniref:ComEC family competence protein n=1 Tax=Candidatus Finniella inopinata TaxID=1696036 RepID=A0A4Q7DKY8_9PROT|nr:ComEC/Rec2 family competence protein [Candidatus Finniella inopinata]RZI47068.1 ComEC family competence protein [Candidatus Finniella inopinata]